MTRLPRVRSGSWAARWAERLAIDAALSHPDRIAGLVLLAPSVSGAPEPAEIDPQTERLVQLWEDAQTSGDLDEINRIEMWLWLDGPSAPEGRVAGAARKLALEMNAIALKNELPEESGKSGLAAWSRLEEITMPVIVACGDLDLPFVVSRSKELVGLARRTRNTTSFRAWRTCRTSRIRRRSRT